MKFKSHYQKIWQENDFIPNMTVYFFSDLSSHFEYKCVCVCVCVCVRVHVYGVLGEKNLIMQKYVTSINIQELKKSMSKKYLFLGFFLFVSLGPCLRHMEIPRLEVKPEL